MSVSVEDADIKDILLKLSRESGIPVVFSKKLTKKVTTDLSDASLKEALSKLLKGLNHAIVYAGGGEEKTAISKIYVFAKSKRSTGSARTQARRRRVANQIRNYERRIRMLKNKLTRISGNSRQKQRYQNQIKSYEKQIERLTMRLR